MVHITGLQNARLRLIRALRTGHWVHEERDVRSEKNLLAVGDVTPEDVILMLQRTRGPEYSVSPHVWDRLTPVHVFRPRLHGTRWYVKAYFLDQGSGAAVFISVHPSESET